MGKREKISVPVPPELAEPVRRLQEFSRQVQKDRARAAAEHAEREAQAKAALAQPPSSITRALARQMYGPPPPPVNKKHKKHGGPVGRPPDYPHDIIRQIARDYIDVYGRPATQTLLREKVCDECARNEVAAPDRDGTVLKRSDPANLQIGQKAESRKLNFRPFAPDSLRQNRLCPHVR
jgi:hypothetical protein